METTEHSRMIRGRIRPELSHAVRIIAVEESTSNQSLTAEGLQCVVQQRVARKRTRSIRHEQRRPEGDTSPRYAAVCCANPTQKASDEWQDVCGRARQLAVEDTLHKVPLRGAPNGSIVFTADPIEAVARIKLLQGS